MITVWLLQRSEPTLHDKSGTQRLLRTGMMADAFQKNGCKVVWWTSTYDHYNRVHRYSANTTEKVNDNYSIKYLKGCGYKRNVSIRRILDNKIIARQFSSLASKSKDKPNLIIASFPTAELCKAAIQIGKKNGIVVYVDIRDLWPDVFTDLVPQALRPIVNILSSKSRRTTKQVFKHADGIIALTDEFLTWGLEKANRKIQNSDLVVPMAYKKPEINRNDPVVYENDRLIKNALRSCEGKLVIVFFGNLGFTNDLDPVFEAASALEKAKAPTVFLICGTGDKSRSVEKKVDAISNVKYLGWVHSSQITLIMSKADIGLAPYIPSKNYALNFPNKPAELLSGGLVLATSLVSGPIVRFITEERCGFSYANSASVLAEKIEYYLDHSVELDAQKNNASNAFQTRLDANVVYENFAREITNSFR